MHINDKYVVTSFHINCNKYDCLFALLFKESVEIPSLIRPALGSIRNPDALLVCITLMTDTFSSGGEKKKKEEKKNLSSVNNFFAAAGFLFHLP